MKITPPGRPPSAVPQTGTSAAAGTPAASFASALAAATAADEDVGQTDFTSMTRQQMFDWMNERIRSGRMSLDESTPFLGMTLKISATTGRPVEMATDPARIDFAGKARAGLDEALSRNDGDLAARLTLAIETMRREQGK